MRVFTIAIVVFLSIVAANALAADPVDGWNLFRDPLPDHSTWTAYYKDHARVKLGPERRLSNGVAWRLHTDTRTGVAFPRITWMPDVRSLRTANRLLDMAHGGSLLEAEKAEQYLQELNAWRRERGALPLDDKHAIVQQDVGLVYASARLVSTIDLGFMVPEGTSVGTNVRGLTFDLDREKIHFVTSCPGSNVPYGHPRDGGQGNYLFQFGELLQVCDEAAYQRFIRILKDHAERGARPAIHNKDPYVAQCLRHYIGEKKDIGENQPIVLYLTFAGLAVFNTEFWPNSDRFTCTMKVTPLNPVIIPYSELEPSMIPGPWRDELLALH